MILQVEYTEPVWCNADSPSPQADIKSSIVLKNLKGKRTHIFTFGKSRRRVFRI